MLHVINSIKKTAKESWTLSIKICKTAKALNQKYNIDKNWTESEKIHWENKQVCDLSLLFCWT